MTCLYTCAVQMVRPGCAHPWCRVCGKPAQRLRLQGLLCFVEITMCARHRRYFRKQGNWLMVLPKDQHQGAVDPTTVMYDDGCEVKTS